jgi:hypothetical protein
VSGQPGFHHDARREMREAAAFSDLERPGLGTEFLDEVERKLLQVMEYPKSSRVTLGQVRKCVVVQFPYVARTSGSWTLYWMRRDLKWHAYDPDAMPADLESLVALVDEDRYGAFFG